MGSMHRIFLSSAVALLAVLATVPAHVALATPDLIRGSGQRDNSTGRSQDYPAKPIRIIVPLAAGGLAETRARIVAQRLGEAAGQTVVVENCPGGAGAIGAEAAARAPADGYTPQGTALPLGSPDEFSSHLAVERQRWGEVIQQAGIRLE